MITITRPVALALAAALSSGAAIGVAGIALHGDGDRDSVTAPAPVSSSVSPVSSSGTDALGQKIRQGTLSGAGRQTHPVRTPVMVKVRYSTSYALVTDVWATGPNRFALSYDRVDLLTGAAAKAYYEQHPELEPADWAVRNVNPMLRQLPVATGAKLLGGPVLAPGQGSALHRITGKQLVAAVQAHPRTLVRITERTAGNHHEVTRLAEVYLP